jgi:hypothetical protein
MVREEGSEGAGILARMPALQREDGSERNAARTNTPKQHSTRSTPSGHRTKKHPSPPLYLSSPTSIRTCTFVFFYYQRRLLF